MVLFKNYSSSFHDLKSMNQLDAEALEVEVCWSSNFDPKPIDIQVRPWHDPTRGERRCLHWHGRHDMFIILSLRFILEERDSMLGYNKMI